MLLKRLPTILSPILIDHWLKGKEVVVGTEGGGGGGLLKVRRLMHSLEYNATVRLATFLLIVVVDRVSCLLQ